MISMSFERPERTVSRASDARNRYKIRYTTNQHRPTSRQVNDHGRVSGTHTRRDIIRCLKRYIAREIHQLLTDPPAVPKGAHLRHLRHGAGVTLADAAQAINACTNRLSELERGTRHNHDLAVRCPVSLFLAQSAV